MLTWTAVDDVASVEVASAFDSLTYETGGSCGQAEVASNFAVGIDSASAIAVVSAVAAVEDFGAYFSEAAG